VRIISGIYKGRKLEPGRLKFTRPTTDFAREGLFNMLNSRIDWEGLDVLDLYSGTGAMAFEFLSHGVRSAVAVDRHIESVKFIASIKEKWTVENLEIIKYEALRYLEKCAFSFDLIFADPPYDSDDYDEILKFVFDNKLIKEGGFLIMEHQKRKSFESHPSFDFHRAFGNVNFSIFRSNHT
jgi:16S rRNA (guanine(966)-N(2))-methyltransferase RsmD